MPAPTVTASVTTANGVSICEANGARSGLIVENTDTNRLYVLLDTGNASATNFTFSLAHDEKYTVHGYSGIVKGLWAGNGSGFALVTEF